MTAVNLKRQKARWEILDQIFRNANNVLAIHYSCEGFYDRTSDRSSRITSIAIRNLDSAQTASYSIHQVAEQQGVSFDEIAQNPPRSRPFL